MSCCLVGLCLNLSTAYAWGAMSRWLASIGGSGGLSVGSILLLYSVPKGVLQLPAGRLADSQWCCGVGAKGLVLIGLGINIIVLAAFAATTAAVGGGEVDTPGNFFHRVPGYQSFRRLAITSVVAPLALLLGAGTACAYSPIMACVASRAEPASRASTLGAYRFWRDAGYAVGGVLLGATSDGTGSPTAAPLLAAAALLLASIAFALSFDYGDAIASTPGASAPPRRRATGLANEDSAATSSSLGDFHEIELNAVPVDVVPFRSNVQVGP